VLLCSFVDNRLAWHWRVEYLYSILVLDVTDLCGCWHDAWFMQTYCMMWCIHNCQGLVCLLYKAVV
jgi:hypothetical protein